jgi:hypothetical protein
MFVGRRAATQGSIGSDGEASVGAGCDADPCELDLDSIDREIGELAAHIAAATCRWLLLVAEFERRNGHEKDGFASCARWLSWRCSVAERAAFENLRVARALGELPLIAEAFAAGRLSYSKVRALTRVADAESERDLLDLAAEATAGQLERILAGYRTALSADDAEEARSRRFLDARWELDGTLRINGNFPAEEGALLLQAIEVVRERLRLERVAESTADRAPDGPEDEPVERRPPPSAADAIVAIADAALAGGGARSTRSGGDRNQVVVHIDLADLQRPRDAAANGIAGDRAPIAPATVKRLACDAALVSIVESGGVPLGVGRKTRSIPPSVLRALQSRDRGCRFPGCGSTRFVDAHHVRHWADGGETSLDNLIQLCRHHHRLVHEAGFTVAMAAGKPIFHRPDGSVVGAISRSPGGSTAGCADASRTFGGRRIDHATIAARSRGTPFDLDLTVQTLACRRE